MERMSGEKTRSLYQRKFRCCNWPESSVKTRIRNKSDYVDVDHSWIEPHRYDFLRWFVLISFTV